MNATLINAQLFDDWLGRLWREGRRLVSLRSATPAERDMQTAVEELRDRIARYEREQPGYAADLRAALAQFEGEPSHR